MGFAHRLTERNIWVKLNENRSKGKRDMERTGKCYRQTDFSPSVSQAEKCHGPQYPGRYFETRISSSRTRG